MGWFKNMVMKMLRIQPAAENRVITITEPLSYGTNVLRNRLWFRGDPSELEQFAMQTATDNVSRARFWAASASQGLRIRKIHSGLPSMIAGTLSDIIIADLDAIELQPQEVADNWQTIAEDNGLDKLLGEGITDTLVAGDGAFKITVDPDVTEYPIIEFYSGEQVDYKRQRGRLQEVLFYTDYHFKDRDYRLEETFGKGYVRSRLLDAHGKEVELASVPETSHLQPEVTYDGGFMMAVPMQFYKSAKWQGRGKSLFDSKNDEFDALDEVISQWVDAIRAGRVQKYIPEDMIPRSSETGELLRPNPFDNQFIRLGTSLAEDNKGQVITVQPAILYEAFVESYASALDMCLQGIISPSTLGIDLKKLDNAEAQREKEKATLYTRGKLVEVLNQVIPQLVDVVLKVYDTMRNRTTADYAATVTFGEYASPSFDAVVETVGKARTFGVMSVERAIEEMYGDTWSDEDKAAEVERLKAEQGPMEAQEPSLNRDPPPDDEEDDPDVDEE
ncbi:capsid protein [Paenibacillus sp. 2TAB23]|uniref:capsid protein n=1 Tax=Paenibacillus sp. 2TAB23 TaxID=3233004 RepID=UPI003F95B974